MRTIERTTLALALALGAATGCDDDEPESLEQATVNAAEAAQAEGESEAADTPEGADPDEQPSAEAQAQAEAEVEAGAQAAAVGQPAPSFTLTDQAGEEHTLADLRGKIVVLEWINPQCPFVQRHYAAGTMTGLDGELPDDEVTWLAIDSSNFVQAADAEAWRSEHDIAYPILLDADGTVGHRYGARTTPHMFVIDAEGVLRYSGAVDDDPRGREEAPTNYVSRTVQALREGRAVETSQTEPYGCSVKYQSS